MSAFEVYLFMTVPEMMKVIFGLSTLCVVVLAYAWIAFFVNGALIEKHQDDDDKRIIKAVKTLTVIVTPLFLVSALFPSKETIALMYVLPEITNEETMAKITKESSEIYVIAKTALINMAEED